MDMDGVVVFPLLRHATAAVFMSGRRTRKSRAASFTTTADRAQQGEQTGGLRDPATSLPPDSCSIRSVCKLQRLKNAKIAKAIVALRTARAHRQILDEAAHA